MAFSIGRAVMAAGLFVGCACLGAAGDACAEASGPDARAVTGVAAGEALNVDREPRAVRA